MAALGGTAHRPARGNARATRRREASAGSASSAAGPNTAASRSSPTTLPTGWRTRCSPACRFASDRADIEIAPEGAGTMIRWRATFRPKVPGAPWSHGLRTSSAGAAAARFQSRDLADLRDRSSLWLTSKPWIWRSSSRVAAAIAAAFSSAAASRASIPSATIFSASSTSAVDHLGLGDDPHDRAPHEQVALARGRRRCRGRRHAPRPAR